MTARAHVHSKIFRRGLRAASLTITPRGHDPNLHCRVNRQTKCGTDTVGHRLAANCWWTWPAPEHQRKRARQEEPAPHDPIPVRCPENAKLQRQTADQRLLWPGGDNRDDSRSTGRIFLKWQKCSKLSCSGGGSHPVNLLNTTEWGTQYGWISWQGNCIWIKLLKQTDE